jgi:non-specific serine/threonine protein kinase
VTAPAAPPRPKTNLPAELTSFINRRELLAQGRSLLTTSRLVTLTGIGGVGKTRTAQRLASSLLRAFPDGGVWFVDLSAVGDPGLVPRAIADVLQVTEQGQQPILDLLVDRLRDARALIVLDNCEHLLDAGAETAERLLAACPDLHVLATSRQPLAVAGEAVLAVDPLPGADARRLFMERGAAACGYEPAPGETETIDQLCERLDRLPLAVELAVGRLSSLSVVELIERLETSFSAVRGKPRRGPARQQTLWATLDWSYELMDEPQRRAWRRLSLFESAFRLRAAEALLGEEAIDLISALVDRSILRVVRTGGRTWYRMLETVRRYGRQRLSESGERDAAERTFTSFYLELAEDVQRRQSGPEDDPEWPAEMDEEQGNLRLALALAARLDGEQQLRLAGVLVPYWDLRGNLSEGRRWLESALDHPSSAQGPRAIGLDGLGWLAFRQNDFASAAASFHEACVAAEAAGDSEMLARALGNVGLISIVTGRLDEADEYLARSLQTARMANLRAVQIGTLLTLAILRYVSGDLRAASVEADACLELVRELGNLKTLATVVGAISVLDVDLGKHEAAEQHLEEALAIVGRIGDRVTTALVLDGCARLAEYRGEHERCLTLAAAAASLRSAIGAGTVIVLQGLVEQSVDRAKRALGAQRADAAWRRGGQLGPDEVLRLASGRRERAPQPEVSSRQAQGPLLTRREQEVADLIAQGLGNRDIGTRLFIGHRTVETHVENILNKLGVDSRAEIAAWIAQHRTR